MLLFFLLFFLLNGEKKLIYRKVEVLIINNLKLKKSVLILRIEQKKNSNLYHLVDLETNSVITALGVKQDVELHKPIQVTLNVRIVNELFELKDGTRKFVNTSTLFAESFKELKND